MMREASTRIPIPDDHDLRSLIRFEGSSGNIWLGQQRMILLHASAFGSMRSELINSFGEEYARGILLRMGYNAALADAQLAKNLRAGESVLDMFLVGPQLHMLEGVVGVEPIKLEMDVEKGHYYGEFTWNNSFEASEHLKLYGISDHSVCWNLLGYATGYTSAFMDKKIIYKEIECVGKGDQQCRIIGKPVDEWEDIGNIESLLSLESMAKKLHSLEEEVRYLRNEISAHGHIDNLITDSLPIRDVIFLLKKAAETDVTVLMLGETGVGKEVFSQALHQLGARHDGPFIAVNCAALPRDLVESELFGVEKGGYTGADKSRPGRFERASGGTLFLDELGELNSRAQAKLLRAIQTGEIERVGGTETLKVNVRLVAATNANLLECVKQGSFRADLYYRLNVFPITIPPLRERLADIPGLIQKFTQRYNLKYGKNITGITDETLQRFSHYDWPGNIRELENIIERGVILTDDGDKIESRHVCLGMPDSSEEYMTLDPQGQLQQNTPNTLPLITSILDAGINFDTLEKSILEAALEKAAGNVLEASRMLGISGPQCRYRLKKLNII